MPRANSDRSSSDLHDRDFGPYRLVRRLGIGGMAETFEAVRTGPGGFTQRVCLKLVLPFFRDDETFVELFQREARLAAKLRHSNIVGVIDFGEVSGTSYMALELIDGADLDAVLEAQEGRRLSHEHVALLAQELAAALDHAHNPPRETDSDGAEIGAIVHRDISPSNVLISRRGEVLLTDFGVAKAVTGTSRKQSAVKGKVPYMSPEQLRAGPIDGRADVFALGVVLYEALSGQRPYEGGNDPATIMLILQGEHPSLPALVPEAPARLCALIERLIDPDPDARPASAAALVELLDEFAPSPKAQRDLGRLVTALAPEIESEPLAKQKAPAKPIPRVEATQRGLGPIEPGGLGRSGVVGRDPTQPWRDDPGAPVDLAHEGPPKVSPARRESRRLRWGIALIIVGVVGVALALWQRGRAPQIAIPPPQVPTAPTPAPAPEPETEKEIAQPTTFDKGANTSARPTRAKPAKPRKGTGAAPQTPQNERSAVSPSRRGAAARMRAKAREASESSSPR